MLELIAYLVAEILNLVLGDVPIVMELRDLAI